MASRGLGNVDQSVLRVLQERLEGFHTPGPGPPQVQIRADEVAVHNAAPAGPRNEHIQTPFASVPVERPEVHRQVRAVDLAVSDTDQDHVPFVSLDVLQVLDEEGFLGMPGEELLARRIAAAQDVDLVLDAARLDVAEGRDAEGQTGGLAGVLHHRERHRLRLGGVDAFSLVGGLRVMAEDESGVDLAGIGAREYHQPIVVELVVRHGDQRLVAAAVVPAQHPLRGSLRTEHAQDALQVSGLALFLLPIVAHPVEEAGRRELFAVPHRRRPACP